MRSYVPSIVLLVLLSAAASGQTPSHLPSMNYWDLTGELIRNEQLRVDLDVSPQQRGELIALHAANSEASQIINFKVKLMRRQKNLAAIDSKPWAPVDIRLSVLNELVPTIKKRLLRILEPVQLDNLRLVAMRGKYGDGYSAFMSKEVWKHCGISTVEGGVNALRMEKENADKLISDAAVESSQRFVNTLPSEARMRFAYYFGPDNFPQVRISKASFDELTNSKIPFPICTSLYFLSVDLLAQKAVGLRDSQIAAIKRLQENLEKEIDDLPVPSPQAKFENYTLDYFAVNAKFEKLCEEVLDDSQKLARNRRAALRDYQNATLESLSRPDFIAYLDLSPDESQAALAAALTEAARLQSQYKSIRKSLFIANCKKINRSERDRLLELFNGVFDSQ